MANLQEYKCPACGGALEFNSGIQKMKCPYCDTEFEMSVLEELDDALNNEGKDDLNWDTNAGSEWTYDEESKLRSYVCKSCGGEIVGDENMAATSCPYCGNPVVMMDNFSGMLKPDYVIPFKLTKEDAIKGLQEHLKGKKLLPKVFKDQNHIEEIKAIYVSFWLFDADADADIRYNATRVRTWSDSRYDYTETEFYKVIRSGSLSFDHVPVDGSKSMPDDLMESIEPYSFTDAVDFQTAYLAGYLADKYDVDAEQSVERANARVKKSTEQSFASTVSGYTTVMPENTNIRLHDGKSKYALYPVWLLNTEWNGQKYTFAMNGQTGKFVGDLPVDKAAKNKMFLGITLGVAAAAYLLLTLIELL